MGLQKPRRLRPKERNQATSSAALLRTKRPPPDETPGRARKPKTNDKLERSRKKKTRLPPQATRSTTNHNNNNNMNQPEMASPLEVACSALGLPTIPKLAGTGADNDAVMRVDLAVSAPNRYTKYQVSVLGEAYKLCTKPTRAQHKAIAMALGLTERQSKIWFQNKRQRQRNALSMSQSDTLKEEITEMVESLRSDLKRKAAQLEELENLRYLLHDSLPARGGAENTDNSDNSNTSSFENNNGKRACVAA